MTPRKAFVLTLTALSFAASTALARPDEDLSATVTVNPVDLVNGLLNFEVEGVVAPRLTLYGGLTFLLWKGVFNDRGTDGTFAVGPEVGLRAFMIGDAPVGLWIGPFAGLAYVAQENADDAAVGGYAGGMLGATAVLFDALALSGGIGAGWHDLGDSYYGFLPRFRVAMGLAF